MRRTRRSWSPFLALGMMLAVAFWFSALPISARAQSQGTNAVYYQSANPPNYPAACCQGSGAFIDASAFASLTVPFCSTLYSILHGSSYPSTGAVIDARGLNANNTSGMLCSSGTTPWNNGTTFVNKPSTILLPAGTIVIPTTWILPGNTHLIGVGDSITAVTTGPTSVGTTIQACNGGTGWTGGPPFLN